MCAMCAIIGSILCVLKVTSVTYFAVSKKVGVQDDWFKLSKTIE